MTVLPKDLIPIKKMRKSAFIVYGKPTMLQAEDSMSKTVPPQLDCSSGAGIYVLSADTKSRCLSHIYVTRLSEQINGLKIFRK